MDLTDCVARIKDHGERADRTQLFGKMVDLINLVGKPEIDENVGDEALIWQYMMRDDMKKFLVLAEDWQGICH